MDEHAGNQEFLEEDKEHEEVGAEYLRENSPLPDAVTEPIRLHVPAKRYLAMDKTYWENLSDASKMSLEVQGGMFDGPGAEEFMAQPYAADAVNLRTFDDLGKQKGIQTPPLSHFVETHLRTVLQNQPTV